MVEDPDAALRDAALAKRLGAAIVEYRVDHLFHGDSDGEPDTFGARQVERLVSESPLPCIITCRPSFEGGGYDGDDASRISLYEHLGTLPHPPSYLDVELATYNRSANLRQKVHLAVGHPSPRQDPPTRLILSAHDFNTRPANLSRLITEMRSSDAAAVHKIAFRARSLRDNLELFEILRHADRPTIALGMGEFGLMSRVLAPKFGGLLTFASLRESSTTAPGQPTIEELTSLYRFSSIGRSTKVYGVIGWPVSHSLSPHVHNAGFGASGHDGVYLPLPVAPEWEHFKATLAALLDDPALDFAGASVTLPHKEHLLRFALEDRSRTWHIDALSRGCGAANTLTVRPDGSCAVLNTDAPALVDSLAVGMGLAAAAEPPNLDGLRVAVIGAGGVARAAAGGLMNAGATVVVYNRTQSRADELVKKLSAWGEDSGCRGRVVSGPWERLDKSCANALINCTPVGMQGGPQPDALPVPESALSNCTEPVTVLDTVYSPLNTPLLRRSRELGLRTIDGTDMFVRQAVRQLENWFRASGLGFEPTRRADTILLYRRIVLSRLEKPAEESPGGS